ncbi:CatA-like O-acetyltransferase [Escherichia coli]|uniref:CatA-like O-acetyltransferase n=1 Tax=Escherichia coli TaxID=562 RepID=UPI003AB92BB9
MFFVSANPMVSFTSFDLTWPIRWTNFFRPLFTMGSVLYARRQGLLMPLASGSFMPFVIASMVGRMLNGMYNSILCG